jgi:DNA-binding MarR family transcriptional regulator
MSEALWPQLREALAGSMPAEARPWLAEIRSASNGTGGRLVLSVTTRTAQDWIGKEYGERILAAAGQLGHEASSLEFRVLDLESPPPGAQPARAEAPADSPPPGTSEPWAKVPLSILCDSSISSNAVRVWAALATFNGYREKYPTVATIGARSGVSKRSVQMALRELEVSGYLAVDGGRGGRGRGNVYTLLPGRKGRRICTLSAGNPAEFGAKGAEFGQKRAQILHPI